MNYSPGFSEFGRLEARGQEPACWVLREPSSCLARSQLLAGSSLVEGERSSESSLSLFLQEHGPLRAPPSRPQLTHHLPKAPPKTIALGLVGAAIMDLEEEAVCFIAVIYIKLQISK